MKILYSLPSLESVYAARFVYEGFKNAFSDLGHEFRVFTAADDFSRTLNEFKPDIFMYSLNFYHLKFIDLQVSAAARKKGLVVFCQIRGWHPSSNDPGARALKDHENEVKLITSGLAGDIFWHWFEQDEPLMRGFREHTGQSFETIHQAADKTLYYFEADQKFAADLAYVGSYLPAKREFFNQYVLPLAKKYNLKVYGSDWTAMSRALGLIQKVGQYFNINPLKKVRRLGLSLQDERKVYSTSKISLNVHEEQVKKFNCEVNERTFKIMACRGFELVDNVPLLRRYFTPDELVIAADGQDWFDKIAYYLDHPEEREAIAQRGQAKVLAHHTYHQRVHQIIELFGQKRRVLDRKR